MDQVLTHPLPLTRGQPFTFQDLADVYMSCYKGRSANQATCLAFFVGQLGHKIATEIDGDDVQDALDALARRGGVINRGGARAENKRITSSGKPLAPASINRYRTVLQGVLTWAQKRRLMPRNWVNPVKETEVLPVGGGRIRFLTEDEYRRLLQAARASRWNMLHVLIKLAVTTGARKGTLMGLRWGDLDLTKKQAFVERTKNDEPFVILLQDDVAFELAKLRGGALDEHLVFSGRYPFRPRQFHSAFQAALADAGIEGVVFHTLRHTHASWLAQKGVPLLAIAESMNHKTLAMTKRYAHLCIDSRAQMLRQVFGNGLA